MVAERHWLLDREVRQWFADTGSTQSSRPDEIKETYSRFYRRRAGGHILLAFHVLRLCEEMNMVPSLSWKLYSSKKSFVIVLWQ